MNICSWLETNARKFPEKLAVICEGEKYSHEEFFRLVKQFGNALKQLGVKPGDRVSVYLPNCSEFLIAHWGIIAIGAAIAPLNVMYMRNEVKYVLNNASPQVLVTDTSKLDLIEDLWPECPSLEHLIVTDRDDIHGTGSFWKLLRASSDRLELHDCDPEDLCDLYYTSGTTGRPKGVMCSHRSFSNLLRYESLVWEMREDDHALVVLPLFHTKGLIIPCMLATLVGGTQTIFQRWDTERVLKTIHEERITFFAGVPTMFTYMLRHPDIEKYDLTSLRICRVGGAPIPIEIHTEFEKLARLRIVEGYGCTGWVSSSNPPRGERVIGSIGKSLGDLHPEIHSRMKIVNETGEEVKNGEVGELIVKGDQLPKGFWRMPGKTHKDYRDGWFYTGDMARKDEKGFFYLVDRKDDLIITSGFNVYPREVEEVLYTHPKVLEAAVVGVDDEAKGQVVKAFIVLRDGMGAADQEIIEHCRQKIAKYKAPRLVEFVSSLPKTSSGKIQRRMLKNPQS